MDDTLTHTGNGRKKNIMETREILHFLPEILLQLSITPSSSRSLSFTQTTTHARAAREKPSEKRVCVCDFLFEISRVSLSLAVFPCGFQTLWREKPMQSMPTVQAHAFCQFSVEIELLFFRSFRFFFVLYLLSIEFTANKWPCKFMAHWTHFNTQTGSSLFIALGFLFFSSIVTRTHCLHRWVLSLSQPFVAKCLPRS